MPIKACTRCGLKVLVDAATAASDNYLCPRCAPDAKPASSSPSAPKSGGKRPSVKVSCPYCGASFSGSKPSRPAKGGCPVCQKELILLPDGTIQAAASFNLAAWQKERKTASNPPSAPAVEAAPELPSTPDPLGGSTILDMGGPPPGAAPAPLPTLDDPTINAPPDLGGATILGMGSDLPEPPPLPTLDDPPPPPPEPAYDETPEAPPDLGGATILDMGPRAVERPEPEPQIDEPAPEPDLMSETMPGMDRPPAEESPVEPPLPPPVPEEPAVDVTEGPTIRDEEVPAPHEPSVPYHEPESTPSLESAPEIPADLGGQTILGMGGADDLAPPSAPAPSIEEPEAVPILAKDIGLPEEPPAIEEKAAPEAPAEEESEGPKPYVYQPIPRKPRTPPPPAPTVAPAPPPRPAPAPAGPPTPPASGAPVLGSDFRIAAPPPPPKVEMREEKRPAGPKTAAIVLPRAEHSLGKMITAWALLLAPVVVVFLLHMFQKNPSVEGILNKARDQALPGIRKMDGEIKKAVTRPAEEVK